MEYTEETDLREMSLHLVQEGMDPGATMSERTCFLWRLYLHTNSSLNTVKQELKHLKSKHVQEMESVQQYRDGIRSLSEQRDSIATGLEGENGPLSTRLREMVLQQEAQRDEVAEILSKAGLAKVIPSSPSEQVAYLLVERASLMEKLQQMKAMETKSVLPIQSLGGTGSPPQTPKESMDKLRRELDDSRQECDRLQTQLKQVMVELDSKISRYNEKQIRHKERLCKAKQLFVKETAWRDEKIKELETSIGVLNNKLEKNNDLMKNIMGENEKLLLDNFSLMKTLREEEEISESSLNTFATMKNRLNHVEKENEHLQEATLVMSYQIAALERLVRTMDTACRIEELEKMSPSQK